MGRRGSSTGMRHAGCILPQSLNRSHSTVACCCGQGVSHWQGGLAGLGRTGDPGQGSYVGSKHTASSRMLYVHVCVPHEVLGFDLFRVSKREWCVCDDAQNNRQGCGLRSCY